MPIHMNKIVEGLQKIADLVNEAVTTLQTEVIYGDVSRPAGVKPPRRRGRKPGPKPGSKRVKKEEVKVQATTKLPHTTTFKAPVTKSQPQKKVPAKKAPVKKQVNKPKSITTKPPETKATIKPTFGQGQESLPGTT